MVDTMIEDSKLLLDSALAKMEYLDVNDIEETLNHLYLIKEYIK